MNETVTLKLSLSEAAQAANALNEYGRMLERQRDKISQDGMLSAINDEIGRDYKLHADIVREMDKTFRRYSGPTVDNIMDRWR